MLICWLAWLTDMITAWGGAFQCHPGEYLFFSSPILIQSQGQFNFPNFHSAIHLSILKEWTFIHTHTDTPWYVCFLLYLPDANQTGVAHEAINNIRRASKTMTEQEARQILGVSENSTWEEIVKVCYFSFAYTLTIIQTLFWLHPPAIYVYYAAVW
jgi:hypothetical protein